jgi:uncharacterized protein
VALKGADHNNSNLQTRRDDTLDFLFVLMVGLVAGTISGIIGTGSSIMLVPILVYEFGPKEAVPIMAVAAIMANLARIMAWWREIDWHACAAYSVTGVPAAALGARTLLILPSRVVDIAIALFLLAMIPARHWLAARQIKVTLLHLATAGAIVGYLTGIVVSTGPLSVSIFLTYGLAKGAFLATEGKLARGLWREGYNVSAVWRAATRYHREGPDRRFVSDGWRVRGKALCASSRPWNLSPYDGRPDADRCRSDVLECRAVVIRPFDSPKLLSQYVYESDRQVRLSSQSYRVLSRKLVWAASPS